MKAVTLPCGQVVIGPKPGAFIGVGDKNRLFTWPGHMHTRFGHVIYLDVAVLCKGDVSGLTHITHLHAFTLN